MNNPMWQQKLNSTEIEIAKQCIQANEKSHDPDLKSKIIVKLIRMINTQEELIKILTVESY